MQALRGRRSLHDLLEAPLESASVIFKREIKNVASFDGD
jgi:hypothetical protein